MRMAAASFLLTLISSQWLNTNVMRARKDTLLPRLLTLLDEELPETRSASLTVLYLLVTNFGDDLLTPGTLEIRIAYDKGRYIAQLARIQRTCRSRV